MKKMICLLMVLVLCLTSGTPALSAEKNPVVDLPLQISADASVSFRDVTADSWYKSAVDGVLSFGLMVGVADRLFAPGANTNRASVVTILWRMSGEPGASKVIPFTDITREWYRKAVVWAYENEIVNGTSKTSFSPEKNITREELATILYRYFDYRNADVSGVAELTGFPDAGEVHDWSKGAIAWACADGIITGIPDGNGGTLIAPGKSTTRAQIATMIMRCCERYQEIFDTTDNPAEDEKYLTYKRKSSSQFKTQYFGMKNANLLLNLNYPESWSFERMGTHTYTVRKDNAEIGRIFAGIATDLDIWKVVAKRESSDGDATVCEYVEKFGTGITLRFRYRYVYSYTDREEQILITGIYDYTQVNAASALRLYEFSEVERVRTEPGFDRFSGLADGRLLILGNSFVGTSKIGSILNEMFEKNQKGCTVNAISRGYARVGTYTGDETILSSIRNGEYTGVFICGLYAAEELDNLMTLLAVCEESGTRLIVFPAHNENRTVINTAKGFDLIETLDWKAEIDAFISAGENKWSFCINDAHLHSTPLAGYVGAHMIYRSIYGEVPQAGLSYSIDQGDVDRVLGDYVSRAYLQIKSGLSINYLD